MQAIRNIYTVRDSQIIIDLPKNFIHSAVEVIILPIDEQKDRKLHELTSDKEENLKQILSIGIWDDNDLKPILETNNLINQWEIQEF